jgi:hypothetical protein
MRVRFMIAIAIAIGVMTFGATMVFTGRVADHPGSIAKAMQTSNTLAPHEMHLNYEAMKELPVTEVKEPF